jgi:glutamyl-tRNA reductase
VTIPLLQVGLDRKGAGLAALEEAHRALAGRPPVAGVALVTCHRVELYLEGDGPIDDDEAVGRFETWVGRGGRRPAPVVRRGEAAARHLLRVAAGLESAIVGDDQILGQARRAYRDACDGGRAGRLLHRLFHAAFRAGRRVRSETALKEGPRSLAGAAAAEVCRLLGDLSAHSVTVVGAGEMARAAGHLLAERGVGRLLVVNRTYARGREVADSVGAEAVPWEWREAALASSSATILAARVSEPILSARALASLARTPDAPFVVADLGVPRNAEPLFTAPPGLVLLDVEGLARAREEREGLRLAAVAEGEGIVEEELSRWIEFARQPGMTENAPGAPLRAARPANCRSTRSA